MHNPSQAALALLLILLTHVSLAMGPSCKQAYQTNDFLLSSQIVMVERLNNGMSSQAFVVQASKGKGVFLRNLQIETAMKSLKVLREEERNFLSGIAKLPLSELQNIVSHNYSRQVYDFQKWGLKTSPYSPHSFEGQRINLIKEVASDIAELMVSFAFLKVVGKISYQGHSIAPKAQAIILDAASGLPIGIMIELLPGKDLASLVVSRQINHQQFQKVKQQVLSQIEHLHQNGLLHGDINPHNIMVQISSSGEPFARLIDFTPPEVAVFKSAVLEKAMFESFLTNLLRQHPLSN